MEGRTVTTSPDSPPPADDARGTLGVGPDGAWQIRFERRLRHSPERVWDALVDPEQQDRWVPGVRIEAVAGGAVRYDFGDEGVADGVVLGVEPPFALEHTWRWPGEPESTVRWEVRPAEDGAVLVLMHRALRQAPAVDYCTGWHTMLDALRAFLDGGDPAELTPDWEALAQVYGELASR